MTDEERADEYASSYGDDNIIDFGDDQLNLFPLRRWSFLDGLKAGKGMNVPTRWHDLRKDPNDLPKVNQKVLLQIKDEDEPITDFYTRNNIWNFANRYEAIAWCEIPKYTEE